MTLALIALLTLAPALDFLPKDKIPTAYFEAVNALRAIEVCIGRAPRPTASAGYVFATEGGDKLVQPVHLRRVPVAAGYGLHFDLAKKLTFPFADGKTLLTPDMICATEHSVQKGADGSLIEHRKMVIGVLREHGELLRPHSLQLNSELMPADVYKISSGMNILMLAALVDAFDFPDKDIARCFWHGFQAIGVVADSFAHRPLQHPTALELAQFNKETREIMLGNEDWADEVERTVTRRKSERRRQQEQRHAPKTGSHNRDNQQGAYPWPDLEGPYQGPSHQQMGRRRLPPNDPLGGLPRR